MRVKKAAFTLAEVLITLAIIGIVAALTIPTLVQNYQTKAWNTASQVFQRKLGEALKVMNVQGTLAGYTTTEAFVDELSKHIKITRICDNDEITACFADTITWQVLDIENDAEIQMIDVNAIKSASDLGQEYWETETKAIQFANGINAIIVYNPECRQDPYNNQISGLSCIAMIYDTDGFSGPNAFLKDIYSVNSFLKTCAFKIGSKCYKTPFVPDAISYEECEAVKDELGIRECPTSDELYNQGDRWASAVKQCGGVNKLMNDADVARIASYIYNTEIPVSGSFNNLKRDYDKVLKLGINVNSSTGFTVFGNTETSKTECYNRVMNPDNTSSIYDNNKRYNAWSFCLDD